MASTHEQEMLAVLERIAGSLNSIKDDIRYLRNQEAVRDAESRPLPGMNRSDRRARLA